MRIALAIVAVLLIALVGTGFYWQHRLAPIMEAKGAKVVPTSLTLPRVGPVRQIDLGFVSFAIPERIEGELVQQDDTLFFAVAPMTGAESALTICPLASEDEPQFKQVLRHYEELTGERVDAYWEFRKRMLHTQPFSVWSIPFRGFRRTVSEMALLVLKGLDSGGADRMWIFEDANVGITMTLGEKIILIQLHDKRARVGQVFLLPSNTTDPQEVVAALASSYRVKTADFGDESLRTELRATGVRQLISPTREAATSAVPMEEDARLQRIAEAVRARRERRDSQLRNSPGR